ncbi:MAG: LPD7 domain-containing protein [Asticcacaulis sp.]|uniref:LPD7 domain-containing protein n=1 Tax=Asticcacaulis sp. TaxID=1872648 RepID=UPI003F7CB3E5
MATKKDARLDVEALSAEVADRFDAVAWARFNSSDMAARSETRFEVMRIRDDLMKVARADPIQAAKIWDEHVPDYVPRPYELPTIAPEPVIFNTIEPGRRRRKLGHEPDLDLSPETGAAKKEADAGRAELADAPKAPSQVRPDKVSAKAEDPNAARIRLLLEGLNKQYLKANEKYHFRNKGGEVAFEAREKRLLTQHDTPTVVTSMIDLAEARGWSSLKLTGTDAFRREAWLQASLRNLEVSGYQPNTLDKSKLEEIRAERRNQASVNTISEQSRAKSARAPAGPGFAPIVEDGTGEPRMPLTPIQEQFLKVMEATMKHRGDSQDAIVKARALANERLTHERIHAGTLVDIGTAPYQDKPGRKPSHYVTLQDDKGQTVKIWGVDLPRALEASGAQLGDKVALAFRGRQPVSVDAPVNDVAGKTIHTKKQAVDRNAWEIVQFDRLREDAKASVLKAVERQDQPARLKVFDRSAKSALPVAKPQIARSARRGLERSV